MGEIARIKGWYDSPGTQTLEKCFEKTPKSKSYCSYTIQQSLGPLDVVGNFVELSLNNNKQQGLGNIIII